MHRPNPHLVFLLSENARGKIKNIAVSLRKSPQLVKYTYKVLRKEGILYDPYGIFDYSRFGLLLFRVYFKGGYISDQEKAKIISFLQQHPSVLSTYELNGEYDLVTEICAPNPSRFTKEMRKISTALPHLNNYKTLLNVVTHISPRSYLSRGKLLPPEQGASIVVGGDRLPDAFSEREFRFLGTLLQQPLARYTTLAKESGMNVKTIIALMKNLSQRKIIRGFQYLIHLERLNASRFRLFLRLHNTSEEREDQLLQYLLKVPEIVQIHKTVGDWNLEIDLESLDQSQSRLLIREIREQFKDIIETFNMMEFYHIYKKSFLPRYLFEGESKASS